LQAKTGEGQGEDDAGAGDGAIHRVGRCQRLFGIGRHDTGIERQVSGRCDEAPLAGRQSLCSGEKRRAGHDPEAPHRIAIGKRLWGMG
jgi:hypothetical protein